MLTHIHSLPAAREPEPACPRRLSLLGRLAKLAAVLLLLTGLAARAEELHLYIWSEYIDPELVKAFEKETGITVKMDLYESNEEMVAKLQAGGVSQYDVVVPSGFIVPVMTHLGLLMPLQPAQIPNLKNLAEAFKSPVFDPGNRYTVGYQYGTVGLIYRKDKLPKFEPSWKMIFDAQACGGPFLLIDSIREMMGIALIYAGKSANTTDLADLKVAAKLLMSAKNDPHFLGFEGGLGGKNKVLAGTAAMALVYNGDAVRAMAENPNVGFVNPKEGTVLWLDNLAIPAKAPNAKAAHRFINFILDAKNGAALSNFNHYATPNGAALPYILKEDLANPAIYPSKAEMAKLQAITDLGKNNRLYDEIWTMIKSR